MIASELISRLTKAKRTRKDSWIACCPAHDDRSPSMTVRELPDGRILLHCFSGCSVEEIVTALGLELSDLFPEKLEFNPWKRQSRERFNPFDIMQAVSFEIKIAALAAFDMSKGMILDDTDRERLLLAATRLNEAEGMTNVQS